MEHTTKPRPKHMGRKVRHMRELLNLTQDDLAEKMDMSQQTVSNIESSEEVDDEQLEKVAKAMGVTGDAIKNLDENAAVYNIVTTNHGAVHGNGFGYYRECTFNPLDKLMETIEKNEKLYRELLKEKDEKVAMLEKFLGGKK
ncbi:helix-turn-helix transcriptional regulator [Fulvivirga sp. M361]|uniref:helix-turn-helix domain-containing protein n=1 Tax=Fulvivirga sp. M361 TaxID=2594266 RepID=UPI00117B2969|nr:helix-turn-helix transcriptional regulator [Fulvivirga sp. M361]TRX58767.1 helix-turn-helix transcriptional regulator [Fulvivirga sp. M361]